MAAAAIPIGEWIGSFFVADTAATAGATAAATGATAATAAGATAAAAGGAEAAADVTIGATSLAGSAAGAGTAAAAGAGVGAAAGAGVAAANAGNAPVNPPGNGSSKIMRTVSEAAAVASGASALATLAAGPGNISVPPAPYQASVDTGALNAEQEERQRLAAAGGLQSTIGTGGGQAGAILNPSTMSQRSLLGG